MGPGREGDVPVVCRLCLFSFFFWGGGGPFDGYMASPDMFSQGVLSAMRPFPLPLLLHCPRAHPRAGAKEARENRVWGQGFVDF